MTRAWPGHLLTVDTDGVWLGECFGRMSNESGGTLPLPDFVAGANHDWVREHFGDAVLEEALSAARSLLGSS